MGNNCGGGNTKTKEPEPTTVKQNNDLNPSFKPSNLTPSQEPTSTTKQNELKKDLNREHKDTDSNPNPANLNPKQEEPSLTNTPLDRTKNPTMASYAPVVGNNEPYGPASREINNGNVGRNVGVPSQTRNGEEKAKKSEGHPREAWEHSNLRPNGFKTTIPDATDSASKPPSKPVGDSKPPFNQTTNERSETDTVGDGGIYPQTPADRFNEEQKSRDSKVKKSNLNDKNSNSNGNAGRNVGVPSQTRNGEEKAKKSEGHPQEALEPPNSTSKPPSKPVGSSKLPNHQTTNERSKTDTVGDGRGSPQTPADRVNEEQKSKDGKIKKSNSNDKNSNSKDRFKQELDDSPKATIGTDPNLTGIVEFFHKIL